MSPADSEPVGASPSAPRDAAETVAAPPTRWARPPGLNHRVLDDEVLVLAPDSELTTLTGLAAPVWLELERPGSLDEVAQRLARRWPTRPTDPAAVADAVALLVAGSLLHEFEPGVARVWGIADDGAAVEVVVARSLLPELVRRWPVLGLRITVDRPTSDQPLVGRLGLGETGLFVPDDVTAVSDAPPETAWGVLEQSLTVVAVTRLEHLVAVHAAVIARDGVALIVPATSGAGKSTLTVAAAKAGAVVLSDEYALLDPDTGLVTGWPRPVRMRRDDGTEERIDLTEPSEPLPVGLVASVTYEPATGNAWEAISASESVVDLLANTIVARTRPDASFDAALAVSRGARAVKGTRGEADEAMSALLSLLNHPEDASER